MTNLRQLRAFVVMPFDPEFQNVYDRLISPALESIGYEVKRADSDLDQQNVLKDVVRGIANADLVLAELTSRNPNVLYELGVSHALRRNTVLITQSMDDIPFDLRTYRVLRYSTQFDTAEKLSEQLKAIGEGHQKGEIDFGSPITDFLPEQYMADTGSETVPALANEALPMTAEGDVEEDGDTNSNEGYLDAILSLATSNEEITKRLQAIGESTEKIGEQFQIKTQEVVDLQAAGGPGLAAAAHRVAGELGKALDEYAAELDAEGPRLETDIETLIGSGLVFTAWLADQDDVELDQAISHRESLAELGKDVGDGLRGLAGFRKTLVDLSGISRDMARGTGRSIVALDRVAGALEQVEAFTEKAIDLLDEKIPPDRLEVEPK